MFGMAGGDKLPGVEGYCGVYLYGAKDTLELKRLIGMETENRYAGRQKVHMNLCQVSTNRRMQNTHGHT